MENRMELIFTSKWCFHSSSLVNSGQVGPEAWWLAQWESKEQLSWRKFGPYVTSYEVNTNRKTSINEISNERVHRTRRFVSMRFALNVAACSQPCVRNELSCWMKNETNRKCLSYTVGGEWGEAKLGLNARMSKGLFCCCYDSNDLYGCYH